MVVENGLHILIVDDQDTVLEILRGFLRNLGFHHVDEAKSAAEALTKLRAALVEPPGGDPFGLVFSDWNMHSISGLQLLQAVRRDPSLAGTPFIMITGEASKDRVAAAVEAGVTSFIVKPFSLELVRKRMVTVLGEF